LGVEGVGLVTALVVTKLVAATNGANSVGSGGNAAGLSTKRCFGAVGVSGTTGNVRFAGNVAVGGVVEALVEYGVAK